MKALFDTNIIIDYLNGFRKAQKQLDLYNSNLISIITYTEVLVGFDGDEYNIIKSFLNEFEIVNINQEICEKAIDIRKNNKIKLPDAIIWATALTQNTFLITRNTKDFSNSNPEIVIPYKI